MEIMQREQEEDMKQIPQDIMTMKNMAKAREINT